MVVTKVATEDRHSRLGRGRRFREPVARTGELLGAGPQARYGGKSANRTFRASGQGLWVDQRNHWGFASSHTRVFWVDQRNHWGFASSHTRVHFGGRSAESLGINACGILGRADQNNHWGFASCHTRVHFGGRSEESRWIREQSYACRILGLEEELRDGVASCQTRLDAGVNGSGRR